MGNFFVSIGLAGSAAGTSFLVRDVPIAEAPLVGGERVIPILEPSMIADLSSRGLEPTQIYVGIANEELDTELFEGGSTVIRAARMFQIAATDLGTSSTGIDLECFFDLPFTIDGPGTSVGADSVMATLCIGPSTCRLVGGAACPGGTAPFGTFGVFTSTGEPSGTACGAASPGATCPAPTSTFDVRLTAAGVPELFNSSTSWTFASSTLGSYTADVIGNLPRNTNVTIESLRSNGLRATTVLRIEGTNVHVLSARLTPP